MKASEYLKFLDASYGFDWCDPDVYFNNPFSISKDIMGSSQFWEIYKRRASLFEPFGIEYAEMQADKTEKFMLWHAVTPKELDNFKMWIEHEDSRFIFNRLYNTVDKTPEQKKEKYLQLLTMPVRRYHTQAATVMPHLDLKEYQDFLSWQAIRKTRGFYLENLRAVFFMPHERQYSAEKFQDFLYKNKLTAERAYKMIQGSNTHGEEECLEYLEHLIERNNLNNNLQSGKKPVDVHKL